MVVQVCNLGYSEGRGRWIASSRSAPTKIAVRACLKSEMKTRRVRCVAQVIVCVPSIRKALGSIPSLKEREVREEEKRKEKTKLLGPRGLTPVILAIQEAEIRRIEVQSQFRQIVLKTLS
jgi:hypothetical protein